MHRSSVWLLLISVSINHWADKSLDPTVNRFRLHWDFTAISRSRFVEIGSPAVELYDGLGMKAEPWLLKTKNKEQPQSGPFLLLPKAPRQRRWLLSKFQRYQNPLPWSTAEFFVPPFAEKIIFFIFLIRFQSGRECVGDSPLFMRAPCMAISRHPQWIQVTINNNKNCYEK